ncbi:MAG: type III pantothenate kinase, partial [Capnocytophaga granulosa]
MLLAVNIGNSNIRFAVVEGQEVHLSWTIATKPYRTAGEFYMSFQTYKEQYKNAFRKISKIVVGSVVPQQTQVIAKMLQKTFSIKPFIVNRDTPS